MNNTSFGTNLKLLCGHFGSVSEVCRRVNINRTQFNKYINEHVIPSSKNLTRICDFFGVEEHEILGPYEEFENIIRIRKRSEDYLSKDPFFHQLQNIAVNSLQPLHEYIGYYYEYYFSMGFQGKILKSIVEIREHENQLAFSRYQRLKPHDSKAKATHCKYEGRVFFLAERMILIDIEQLRSNEITQTVLYPNYLSKLDYLTGIKLGISVRISREPCATRVLYQYLGKQINFRHMFKSCGLYDADSPLIAKDIKDKINNHKSDKDPLFLPKL